MDQKPQKPPFLFTSPFAIWTDLALKLWGFGEPAAPASPPEKQLAVAVIPTTDAQPPRSRKRTKRKIRKSKSKRARSRR